MTEVDVHAAPETSAPPALPVCFRTTAAALKTIEAAVRQAGAPGAMESAGAAAVPGEALDALLLLRNVRRRLATWEPYPIEVARETGASWADIAHPLGVSSRQAAERRYLRLRTGPVGATGEQRTQATRDRRAASRTVTVWARDNAADLRRLAGQITSLTDLPYRSRAAIGDLSNALGDGDAARLIEPLAHARPYLEDRLELADRVDRLVQQTERLRRRNNRQRRDVSVAPEQARPNAALQQAREVDHT
ncbi:hypothetical protein [Streptomyces sp. NPDC005181]|uniref:hypothetical protein n=1 Tax=Streptomyces sp. NPDC005181 TaxID=3156869 RepID=UPI0033B047EE